MKRIRSLPGLIAVLALIGLIFAPAAPAFGVSAVTMQSVVSRPGDMACCPDGKSFAPECSKACPFAVACAAVTVSIQTSDANASFVRPLAGKDVFAGNAIVLSSLVRAPPPRPPQN